MYNRKEFIEKVAENTGMTKKAAGDALKGILATLKEIAEEGEGAKVQLTGDVTFEVKKREARAGRNPQTGESIEIPERLVQTAKFSKTFLD